jgi:hypothetical protein
MASSDLERIGPGTNLAIAKKDLQLARKQLLVKKGAAAGSGIGLVAGYEAIHLMAASLLAFGSLSSLLLAILGFAVAGLSISLFASAVNEGRALAAEESYYKSVISRWKTKVSSTEDGPEYPENDFSFLEAISVPTKNQSSINFEVKRHIWSASSQDWVTHNVSIKTLEKHGLKYSGPLVFDLDVCPQEEVVEAFADLCFRVSAFNRARRPDVSGDDTNINAKQIIAAMPTQKEITRGT